MVYLGNGGQWRVFLQGGDVNLEGATSKVGETNPPRDKAKNLTYKTGDFCLAKKAFFRGFPLRRIQAGTATWCWEIGLKTVASRQRTVASYMGDV